MAGRPTKFTQKVTSAIIKNIRIGATFRDAAGAAGVDYESYNNWMKRGEAEGEGPYFDFFVSVEQAKHDAILQYVGVINKAAKQGDWRAALEYLRRRDREHWGDNVDLTTGGNPLTVVFKEPDNDNSHD
jgi:hypothetical protein